jgi:Tol biopolymer transport system component
LAFALMLGGSQHLLAGKGGGKGKPGGGGGGGDPAHDPAIAFTDNGALVVVNADGSNRTVVVEAGSLGRPSWSPDGSQLAFQSDVQGLGIYVIRVDGTGLRKIASKNSSVPNTAAWSPAPSADGRYKIAFADQSSPGWADIFLVNPDGTGLVNLTNTPDEYEFWPTWSPTADRLAVSVQPTQANAEIVIYAIGVLSGLPTITGEFNLTSDDDVPGGTLNDANVSTPSWSKTQDLIVVGVTSAAVNGGSGRPDDWVIDLSDPANPVNITESHRVSEHHPSFSPDGLEIAVYSSNLKPAGIYAIATDGSGATRRIVKGGYWPVWRRNP